MRSKLKDMDMAGRMKWKILLMLMLWMSSCSRDIRMEGFEPQKWKEDAHGCKGYREKVAGNLVKQRKMLTGANEMEIKKLLGKPDSQELLTRGQHYFVYEIKGGSGCEDQAVTSVLRIRFDALNRVSELAVY